MEGWRASVIFHFLSRPPRVDTAVHGHRRPLPSSVSVPGLTRSLQVPAPYPIPTDLHAARVPANRAAALTQSAQQDGLAPFLRLRPLFVAGPEQGL